LASALPDGTLMRMASNLPLPIHTIGHSTRPLHELVPLLRGLDITRLIDVRTVPKSRHNPQYNSDALAAALPEHGIAYQPMAALGGLRHPRSDSRNLGWRNASFRGFADYMQTGAFEAALTSLCAISANEPCVIMCAEAVPWRCHRSLIADALAVRRLEVRHIIGPGEAKLHLLTPFAMITGTNVTYPPDAPDLFSRE
jgi:uncharacterized protein (DUF488 family)